MRDPRLTVQLPPDRRVVSPKQPGALGLTAVTLSQHVCAQSLGPCRAESTEIRLPREALGGYSDSNAVFVHPPVAPLIHVRGNGNRDWGDVAFPLRS
jgi:hypothetical protein